MVIPAEGPPRRAIHIATVSALLIIAFQVAGKAARDALFLSNFDIRALPVMLIGASLVSIAAILATSRLMATLEPGRLVPTAFAVSALLLLVEWSLALSRPRAAAVLVYLHVAALGAILVSGFWSVITERFDPRTARKQISRIAGGGTLGGVVGGLAAERTGAALSVSTLLPILALMHIACAALVYQLRPPAGQREGTGPGPAVTAGLQIVRRVPYLKNLSWLVLLGTVAAALIDYVFKAQTVAVFSDGQHLLRFFAVFYTASGLLTFLVQIGLSRWFLNNLGLGQTVSIYPSVLGLGVLGALLAPGLASATLARGGEAILRSSVFRSAYELFFTPIRPGDKRATKTWIDVGSERAGDAAGGVLVRLVLFLAPVTPEPVILVLAALCAGAALAVARRLQRGYVETLEQNLLGHAGALDPEEVAEKTTRVTLMQSMGAVDVSSIMDRLGEEPGPGPAREKREAKPDPPSLVGELESRDPKRIKLALARRKITSAEEAEHVLRLVAWDEISPFAVRTLRRTGFDVAPLLDRALSDPEEAFTIRRRIPRILSRRPSAKSVAILLKGLEDRRFEVRFQSGLALARLQDSGAGLTLPADRIFELVLKEVAVDRSIWESHQLLDQFEDESPVMDAMIRWRTTRSMEHVFTVLSLVLPREPLRIALAGLYTEDPHLRGTALEYLESVLPDEVREKLWPFLEIEAAALPRTSRSRQQILDDLMRSHESISIKLSDLQDRDEG